MQTLIPPPKAPPQPDKMAARLINRIERDLAARGWPQGAQIGTEPELLKRYGVSRAVFREAIRIGEHRGILRMQRGPRGGLIVGAPSMDRVTEACAVCMVSQKISLREVSDAVVVLGPVFAGLAVERSTESDVAELARMIGAGRVEGYDTRFRTMIARLPRNPAAEIFTELVGRVVERAIFSAISAQPDTAAFVAEAQRRVLGSLMIRDASGATEGIIRYVVGLAERHPELADAPVVTPERLLEFGSRSGVKLAETTAQAILQDVLGANLTVGHMLGSEPELMAKYGVSRAAFREAVRLVEYNQIARMRRGPGGGLVVVRPSLEPVVQSCATFLDFRGVSAAQLIEIRKPLEAATVARLVEATQHDPSIIDALEVVLDRELAAGFDLPSDQSMHVAIAERCGSRSLMVMVEVLAEISDRRLNAGEDPELGRRLLAESEGSHRALLDAIRSGDSSRAQQVMTDHLSALRPFMH